MAQFYSAIYNRHIERNMSTMKGFSKATYRQIWFDRIRAMRQSGLSQKAFAERESLQPWQLADRVRRFNQAAAESVVAAPKFFIPVQLSPDLTCLLGEYALKIRRHYYDFEGSKSTRFRVNFVMHHTHLCR